MIRIAMTTTPLLLQVVNKSVILTYQAGDIIRDIMKSGQLGVVDKGINDLQTQADRSAQTEIVAGLLKSFPNIKIVGEEDNLDQDVLDAMKLDDSKYDKYIDQATGHNILDQTCPEEFASLTEEDLTVWVDPLDGTNEFAKGYLDHVTTLIGISYNKVPIAGVIYQPYYSADMEPVVDDKHEKLDPIKQLKLYEYTVGRVVWGIDKLGVFGLNENRKPLEDHPSDTNNIIISSMSHGSQEIDECNKRLAASKVIKMGGCGNKCLRVLEGYAHAYIHPSTGTKRWDSGAPEAILRAMGGAMVDCTGTAYVYDKSLPSYTNTTGLIAVPKADWVQFYEQRIPEELKNKLKQL